MDRSKKDMLKHFSRKLAQSMGLSFSAQRLPDLERGLERVTADLGFSSIESLVFHFTSNAITSKQIQILARYLTVGETYFFRDEAVFHIFEHEILPELIRKHHPGNQRLRLWSAGCCTGEEAYSLAISVCKSLPTWREWNIQILATDINPDFLAKARVGEYGNWSFRTTPREIQERYFSASDGNSRKISGALQELVSFKYLNLATDGYGSVNAGHGNFDVIFCRNVLMYFTAAQAAAALRRLSDSLAPGGWLILGPSELNIRPGKYLQEIPSGGMRIYRKRLANRPAPEPEIVFQRPTPPISATFDYSPEKNPSLENIASQPVSQAAVRMVPTALPDHTDEVNHCLSKAKLLANKGDLTSAIESCDKALAMDKTNASVHYLRGILLHESADYVEAERSLKRSIYLDSDLIVAHFALGNLKRSSGHLTAARKHFENARAIAIKHSTNEGLRESDGLTAGRLVQIIDAIFSQNSW